MKCSNCCNEINESSDVCEFCGAKINKAQAENTEIRQVKEEENALSQAKDNEKDIYREDKKYNNIVTVLSIIIVAFFAVVCIKNFFGGFLDGSSKNIVYVCGDSLYFKANIDSEKEPIKVYEFDDEYMAAACKPQISPDSRYIYFISNIDKNGRATLSKIKITKLRRNIEKNEKHLVTIDEETNGEYYVLDKKDQVLYFRDNELIFKKGKKETVIDEAVKELRISNDNKHIAYITYDGDLYSYALTSKKAFNIDEDIDINRDIEFVCGKDNNVIYAKDGDLYVYTGKKEVVKIDKDMITYFTNDMDNKTKTALRNYYLGY